MRQDVSLPATPAVARQLMRLAKACRVELDPGIAALADHGLISDEAWDAACPTKPSLGATYRDAVQFALDTGLRAVIPDFDHWDRISVAHYIPLLAARLAETTPVVIVTANEHTRWRALAEVTGVAAEVVSPVKAADEEFQRDYRQGVLIISWERISEVHNTRALYRALATEWERTLVFGNPMVEVDVSQASFRFMERNATAKDIWNQKISKIDAMASVLTPSMPVSPLVTDRQLARRGHLLPRGFRPRNARDTAFLCSVWAPPEGK